jgi:predicted nucleic acid-binding protein
VVIEILRGRKAIIAALSALEARGVATFTCGVVVAEILAGLRAGEEAATESFFHARGDVVIDGTTGRRAGSYLARYARSHGVEIADALVAAAAATTGLLLWSLNRKHYPMGDVRFLDA